MELDTSVAPGGGEQEAFVPAGPATEATYNSPNAAAKALAEWRYQKNKESSQPPVSAEPPAAPVEPEQPELADEANAAPPEEISSETQAVEPAVEQPTIDPPRSWTKEEKEAFKLLPPEHQKVISERERTREVELRRSQNEAAEQRKALDAKAQEVEAAKQHYEAALPALLQALHDQHQGEFADIKSMADVERLSREDWPRYIAWDAQQKKIAVVQNEIVAAQQRQAEEFNKKWSQFVTEQDRLFLERAPEFADEKQAPKATAEVRSYLKDIGITDDELSALWNGKAGFNLRDHRAQLIIRDASRYRAAQEAAKVVTAKPVPPVQRPGVAAPKASPHAAEIQALEKKSSLSLREAGRLRQLKMASERRAS